MNATKILTEEHKAIKQAVSLLDKAVEKLMQNPGPPFIEHMAELMEFFREFVDRCHHGKEENFLFPAAERAGVLKSDGPITQLLGEHARGRQYVRQIETVIPLLGQADTSAVDEANLLVKSYGALMRQHIRKEDSVFFPLADKRLSEDEQADLVQRFDTFEREEMGEGRHEHFHDLLSRLSREY